MGVDEAEGRVPELRGEKKEVKRENEKGRESAEGGEMGEGKSNGEMSQWDGLTISSEKLQLNIEPKREHYAICLHDITKTQSNYDRGHLVMWTP